MQAWLQRTELHASAGVLGRLVPAEVAQLVSLQTPGMVALPSGLENAIGAAASGEAGPNYQTLTIHLHVAHLLSFAQQRSACCAPCRPAHITSPPLLATPETNRKLVKQKGQQLTQRLRHLSRSKHRGGVHPNLREHAAAPTEPAPPAARRSKVRPGSRGWRAGTCEAAGSSHGAGADVAPAC